MTVHNTGMQGQNIVNVAAILPHLLITAQILLIWWMGRIPWDLAKISPDKIHEQ